MVNLLIKLEDVWKIFKIGEMEFPVLRGISLEIPLHSFVSIMGPSGSGKSSLIYLLGLLDSPTKGKIFFEGEDTSKFSEDKKALLRGKKIGFVFQQFNLIQNLTAFENVVLPAIFQGTPEMVRKERALNLLRAVGLGHRINHKPTEMSGGEQQRVAIARALINNPDLLIADEPTGNLDSKTGKVIMEILKRFHQEEKKTIIVVSHDPNIAQYSQEIIHIRDGQIISNHFREKEVLWKKE